MALDQPLLQFVLPADVRQLQGQIAPYVDALRSLVSTCDSLDTGNRTAWGIFAAQWDKYLKEDVGFLNAGAEYNTAKSYQQQTSDWQKTLFSKCGAVGPVIPDPSAGGAAATVEKIAGYAAIAAGAFAVVYVLRTLNHKGAR